MDFQENKNRNQINIVIIGAISVGKSTLLNTIFNESLSDCKLKRTTMTPQVYYENSIKNNKSIDKKTIREINKEINTKLIQKSENNDLITKDDIQEVKHIVNKIHKFTELKKDIFLTIYDIPGLNDGRTKEVFMEYIENNFNKFDIIIFVVDINSALNTTDEVEILEKILNNCKKNKDNYNIENKLIVLASKCDEMYLENDKLVLEEEMQELYDQIKTMVDQKIEQIIPDLEYSIIPISCEDSYIYRMYSKNSNCKLDMKYLNKFGQNEYGKKKWNRLKEEQKEKLVKKLISEVDIKESLNLTGFNNFRNNLNIYLNPKNQKLFINNHIIQDIQNIKGNTKINIEDDIQLFYKYYKKYNSLEEKIKEGINTIEIFEKYFTKYLENWFKNIILGFIELKTNVENETYYIKQDNYLDQIQETKDILDNAIKLFNGDIKYLSRIHKNITVCISNYYIDKINNKTISINICFEYLNKLKENKFIITTEIIDNIFSNLNILNKTPKEIINYLELLYKEDYITLNDKKEKVLYILEKIYDYYYKNDTFILDYNVKNQINYCKNIDLPSYLYFVSRFWNIFIISYENYEGFNSNIYDLDFKIKLLNHKYMTSSRGGQKGSLNNNKKEFLILETYYQSLFIKEKNLNKINESVKKDIHSKDNIEETDEDSEDEDEYEDIDLGDILNNQLEQEMAI